MKRRVSETFGLDLKEEVLFLGDRGSDQDKQLIFYTKFQEWHFCLTLK
jgi:hypothetical protein